jgi:8-oxo-dGTP pyrophosphatase MutT (NUDIX family)
VAKINWFTGAVIYRWNQGVLEFLLQNSKTTIPKFDWQGVQVKFPGGRDDPEDISFLDTLKRELKQELYLEIKPEISPVVIFDEIRNFHRKIFYLVPFDALVGEMRDVEILDGSSILSVPYWVPADKSVNLAYKIHKKAAINAIGVLRKNS